MNVDVKTRKELNELSKEVFGSSSRWQKIITKGYAEVSFEEVTETVPAAKEGDAETTQTAQKPVMVGTNAYKQLVKYQTLETVREYMLERKKQLDEIRTKIAQMQAEAKAKQEAAKEVQDKLQAAAGSSV